MKLFFKHIFIFLTPFLVGLVIYFIIDPFKVIWHYDSYYEENSISCIMNRDFVTVSNFENQYEKEKYNSFILGNSTSMHYETSEWKKYLTDSNKIYHFNAYGQTLYEIYHKMMYLDAKNIEIKNVLLVLDNMVLNRVKPRKNTENYTTPQIVKYKNIIGFHSKYISSFFNAELWYAYFDYSISGKYKPYMNKKKLLLPKRNKHNSKPYNKKTNELYNWDKKEKLISRNKYYNKTRFDKFKKRRCIQREQRSLITVKQKDMLSKIFNILDKKNTNYRIVFNPMSNQNKLSSIDLNYLNSLFGENNVFDFSGINHITENIYNYYDPLHYRVHVANEILEDIYSTSK